MWIFVLLATAPMLGAAGPAGSAPSAVPSRSASCPGSQVQGRYDFHGLTMVSCNFSGADLSGANFQGATLTAVVFVRAKLVGADFSGATFVESGYPAFPNDFTMADLRQAKFTKAQFNGLTYFNYAQLSSADFSGSGLSIENAVFGESLDFDPSASPRLSFAGRAMNCEFVAQWSALDLSGANISSCASDLSGRDLNGAIMPGVDFSKMVLDGSQFARAVLTNAVFTGASLQCTGNGDTSQCVDFSAAQLQGANFDHANLSGASLYGAFLSNDAKAGELNPASVLNAHLKNVNLAFAQLSGIKFTHTNFYGSRATNPTACATTGANYSGFTKGCATAHAATMVGTSFAGAYVYGVDLTNATIAGVTFDGAVLVGANFAAAQIGPDVMNASETSFLASYLQGTNMDQAQSLAANLTDAFMDFEPKGNMVNILLVGGDHNTFSCGGAGCNPATGANVCVLVAYSAPTTVSAGNQLLTCPNDKSSGAAGCGDGRARNDSAGPNPSWQSSLDIHQPPDPPKAWYSNPATYTDATARDDVTLCGGIKKNPQVVLW